MNIVVNGRHMEVTVAMRQYVEAKIAKLPRFYDNVRSVEVVLDIDAEKPFVEIVATARRRNTFVATHRGDDMYACFDQCLDKITEQLRRHKDRVRDRRGPGHGEALERGEQE